MNKLSINKTRLARRTAAALIVCAAALTVSALLAQSSNKPQWPSLQERPNVKLGFTKALTRSAKDHNFRDRLIDFTNQGKVKAAVMEELHKVPGAENMVIPDEIVLMFYEPQKKGVTTERQMSKSLKDFLDKRENRNYHVFYLPDYNPSDTAEHPYDVHIMCCYKPW